MNKTISKTLVAVSAALMISTIALADGEKFGVGVSVNQDTTKIRGTINLDKTMRLEPFLGFGYTDLNNGSKSNFQIGTGFHLLQPLSSKMSAYYGGYVEYQNVDNGVTSSNGLGLGPVAGVEYALDEKFTLGAEVSFAFDFGDNNNFGTNSEILLRYYF